MGLLEWIRKFYPTEARECTKTEALKHSRQKWHGLKPENLKEFGCEIQYDAGGLYVIDSNFILNEEFCFGGSTCALCQVHNADCTGCPIEKAGERCDVEGSVYFSIIHNESAPQEMIDLLDRLYCEEQQMLIDNKL